MSIKDLEPLQPTSPFYPTFIPTGQQVSVLFSQVKTYSSTTLTVGSGQLQVFQVMDIPLAANVAFFNCQLLSPNGISNQPFTPYIKLSDISYDSNSDTMSWYFDWNGLAASDIPVVVCTVLYFL